ncbi:MAG: helix-turn-helix transcriptional regulator [Candidatus Heimdallarchaeota archaeon]|nr:helix-turn-helix transcriptional regulator [Candidatus Heimdallarchaeota archaeon]MCG3254624.1 helix-turn-helix transcriptional regulator [Candidatus Heimdallarchaeota archaeon]MCK4609706.1 helix-turn-helix transcriptional regulator [Candidatus Heimdallarchaeota archaeon]
MEYSKRETELIITLAKCEDIEDASAYYDKITEYGKKILNESYLANLSKLLEAFSHVDRILIVRILMKKDRCVCELEAILGKSQSNISYHLKILENLNLVKGWKKGKFTHYSIVQKSLEYFKDLFNNWINDEIFN